MGKKNLVTFGSVTKGLGSVWVKSKSDDVTNSDVFFLRRPLLASLIAMLESLTVLTQCLT